MMQSLWKPASLLILEITKGARSLLSQYNILKNGQVYVESSNESINNIASEQQDSIVSFIKGVEKIDCQESRRGSFRLCFTSYQHRMYCTRVG